MRRAHLVLLSLALVATACSSKPAAEKPSPSASARPSSTGVLGIIEPAEGSSVKGPTVRLKFGLTGARIVPLTTTNLKPDEGHLHVLLDGRLVTMTSGLSEDLKDVKPGRHIVRAEFVAGDHAPFNPRVIQTVSFTVT